MKNDDLVVCGQPQIALDPGSEFERGGKRNQAVFGEGSAGMQPAMSEPRRSGI
jgi:hypothetical protein